MKHLTYFLTTFLLLMLLAACAPVETANPASNEAAADVTSAPAEIEKLGMRF